MRPEEQAAIAFCPIGARDGHGTTAAARGGAVRRARGEIMSLSQVDIVAVDDGAAFWDDRSALLTGLRENPPRIPAHFGYDALGSDLFELITELPDYYLTRVEYGLLKRNAGEIADLIGCGLIAEMGSGSAKKTRLLLAACVERRATSYLPIDVSREMLEASGRDLTAELPDLRVRGLWGRYEAGLAWLRDSGPEPLTVSFLGSNFGNMPLEERDKLLSEIVGTLRPGDGFLVSVDLLKPARILESAYNDPAGRSAFTPFRLNHLDHLNRRFGGNFDARNFSARAHFDAGTGTVDARVYATEDHSVALHELDLELNLRRGDSLNVGLSHKFRREQFVADVTARGLELRAQWTDEEWQYGIFLFTRSSGRREAADEI
ncbi:L-histidine N(alpha)-methyltransferase [Streptomyces sp. NBC_01433]|uniref:L-histidine N(alpha)-methyltransferase n=1 Tax=Streptomyces sp. NBC_01433 TaxID=2903864 RepID=UPI0022591398|nr:L-histidine N(alpha)-methyltransferase [Streptomyces sp. NBC_01433]MCX4679602.1 L-histidine N(alpha)-methyltransferase [Streptomyces sp. NBC_01433]